MYKRQNQNKTVANGPFLFFFFFFFFFWGGGSVCCWFALLLLLLLFFGGKGYVILNLSNILRMKYPTTIITIGIKQLLCTFHKK